MLRSSCFRRVLCLFLVFCFVFCALGDLKASADAGAGAIFWELGTAVGITPETAIACILVLLGVAVVAGNADTFWDLVEQISIDKHDALTTEFTLASGAQAALVRAWYYDGTYHFPRETIETVHDYLTEDTVTYDAETDSLIHSGYVYNGWTTTFGEGTLDRALTWLFCNYPDLYELANSYDKCTALHYDDGTWRYIFSDESLNVYTDDGFIHYEYPDNHVAVHVNSDGTFAIPNGAYGMAVTAMEEGLYYYKSRIPVDTSNLARNLDEYPALRVIECSAPDPDDSGHDITIPLIALSIIGTQNAIEDMTIEEAQSGEIAEPDVVVDLETGEVIDANGDTAVSVFGQQVVVDAETAIASILISLGVSPGSSNTDFRQLITDIISVLPSDYTYSFESVAYGNKTLLNAWLYNDIYYFKQDIMEFVNNYIWGNTEYAESIFTEGEFSIDSSYIYYDVLVAKLYSAYPSRVPVFESAPYACVFKANGLEFYLFSNAPITYTPGSILRYLKLTGPYLVFYGSSASNMSCLYSSTEGQVYDYNCPYEPESEIIYLERAFGASIDVDVVTIFSSLADFDFDILTVSEDGADLTYYPVKLFPSLDDTEAATQTEIQTDYITSVPNIVVDPDTRVIIEVNIPGSEEVPDPDPDPTTSTDPDTGTDTDSTTATTPGGGSGTGGDSSDSDSGSDNVQEGTGAITEDGLWAVLVRFGEWLVNLLWSPFRWLGNMLLEGVWPFFEWLGSVLISGIRTIIEWLANTLLTGIQEIFVPSEDFLTNKIDTLCEEFVFAYAIMETAQLISDSLSSLGTSPPVVYINLGAATGSYYYGSTVPFIDMRWYAAYKPVGDALLSALLWICFCWRVFVKLPGIISGVSGQFSYMAHSDDRVSRQ